MIIFNIVLSPYEFLKRRFVAALFESLISENFWINRQIFVTKERIKSYPTIAFIELFNDRKNYVLYTHSKLHAILYCQL